MQTSEASLRVGPADRISGQGGLVGTMDERESRQPAIVLAPGVSAALGKISGILLVLFSVLMLLSLATWSADDPSLTFANGRDAQNWLGYTGASFADLGMQFFGFAILAPVLCLMIWGLMRLSRRSLALLRHRLLFLVGGTVLLTAALGCVAVPSGWPLYVGLGGVVGDALLGFPAAFTGGYPGGLFAVLLAALTGFPSIYLLLRSCNLHKGLPVAIGVEPEAALSEEIAESDDPSEPEEVKEGTDWSGMAGTAIGFGFHLAYSAVAIFRKQTGVPANIPTKNRHLKVSQFGDPDLLDQDMPIERYPDVDPFDDGIEVDDRMDEVPSMAMEDVWEDGEQDIPQPQFVDVPPLAASAEPERMAPKVTRVAAPVKAKNARFQLPKLDLLTEARNVVQDETLSNEVLTENARLLEGVLDDFGVKGQIIQVRPGPVVTLYELEPAPGIKSSRVIGLADDIARSMSAIAARVAVVPGRNAIGIELPNKKRETVYLREQFASKEFRQAKAKLPMCLGKTIGGEPVIADMAKMPHLLVAGTTGSGKSVAINTMILSLLFRHTPEQVKLIMIDPKMLELSIYDGIPHLLTPVVVDPKKAVVALKWTVREMEERYKKMSKLGVRNIDGFNTRVKESLTSGEPVTRTVQTGFDRDTGEAIYETEELELSSMPYIVVVIDEMADLMMVAGKDIEGTVQRLAQMARAAGIHVIMATQRPSTDVITGTIKANFPTRISFQVTSKIDSRVMLGESGAEQLLGMGDMLYMAGGGRITRVHGPFVDDHEVEDVVNHLKTQGTPQYLESITEEQEDEGGGDGYSSAGDMGDSDDPYDQAVAIVLRDRKASTSYIQRRLSVGYNKAASLIERMEQEGLISPANHAGKREILVPAEDETI